MPLASNLDLRRRLQEITDMSVERGMVPDQLELEISGLASTHPHSIRRLREDEAKGYRCFVYAFELVDSPKYQAIANADMALEWDIFFAGSVFARFLIEHGAPEKINESEIRPDDVVVYLDGKSTPKHAGKIAPQEGRIKSKWGGGLFLEHGILEVPENYGNTVNFYRRIPCEQAEKVFLQFVKSHDRFQEFCKESADVSLDLSDLFDV